MPNTPATRAGAIRPGRKACASPTPRVSARWPSSITIPATTTLSWMAWRVRRRRRVPAPPPAAGRWRRLKLGLPTVLGLKPRGWFIPHRYAPLLPPPGAQPPYPAIEQLFEEAEGTFTGVLDAVDAHATQLESVKSLF